MLLSLTEEEKAIDEKLGYPAGYAKLCRHALAQPQGVLTPFAEGPPQRFVPYAPPPDDLQRLKEWDAIFPIVPDSDKEVPHAHEYAEELWEQLDHLGNAGFDPAKFRVDAYGNVLYWSADPSSPLSWEVDHWFPHSRGGRTIPSNLQIVQWQARQRKKNRLEFLVPWWDLQHGVSINQFISTFASKNAEFRRRSFALFFAGGEDEQVVRQHVGDCRPWPPQFRGKKAHCGLAGAAVVSVRKEIEDTSKPARANILEPSSLSESSNRRRWSVEEEDGLRRAVQRLGPGSWKEIRESEPVLTNRTAAQIKDKYRSMKDFGKENNAGASAAIGRGDYDRQSVVTNTMQKELRLKMMREEGKREKEEEVAQLEETVRTLKEQNEKERVAILELEGALSKQKQRVEKQRRWAETQSSYRLCLERMIRDTMHQSISYKEQARLNQAACNALMARLDCQKMTCEAAEKDLLQRYSQREALAALVKPDLNGTAQKKPLRGRDIVDVSSCLSMVTTSDGQLVTPEKGLPRGDISDQNSDIEDLDDIPSFQAHNGRPMEFVHQEILNQEITPTKREKETSLREVTKRKAASIVAPSHQEKKPLHQKDAEPDLRSYDQIAHETENEIQEEKDDLHESKKSKGMAIIKPEDIGIMEIIPDKDHVEDNMEGSVTGVGHEVNPILVKDTLCSEVASDSKDQKSLHLEIESKMSEARLDGEKRIDELMQEVITTHVDKIKDAEAAAQEPMNLDDEKIREIGKSNIDKWLHVLLDEEFPRISTDEASPPSSSPNSGQPPLSPALSALSMAALRGSVELDEGRVDEFLKKEDGFKGRVSGLLRKLSVKHVEEEGGVDLSPRVDNRHNLRNALKSFEDFKLKDGKPEEEIQSDTASGISIGSVIPESVRNWPEGGIKPKGGAEWYKDPSSITEKSPHSKSLKEDPVSTQTQTIHKKSVSEAAEALDFDNWSSGSQEGIYQALKHKDGLHDKHGLRATLKACTLKWRKAVKKIDKPLQEGGIPLQHQ